MKNYYLTLLLLSLFIPSKINAQFLGSVLDTTGFSFNAGDSLSHYMPTIRYQVVIDTSDRDSTDTHLWQIGNTTKTFFANGGTSRGIMTDTLAPYPISANSSFILKLNFTAQNTVVWFTHKYQSSIGRDGGTVEFSVDSMSTWNNVLGPCNVDSSHQFLGIVSSNFYHLNDTIQSGLPAFTGVSNGWITSGFKFQFTPLPIKETNVCNLNLSKAQFVTYVRFRFVSDSIPDSLAGWMLDNIYVEQDYYGGAVQNVKAGSLKVYPNPSWNGLFNFPALTNESAFTVEISNAIGQRIYRMPYSHTVNMAEYAPGIYFYKVTNSTVQYNGKLMVQ